MANTTAIIVIFGSGIPEAPTNFLITSDTPFTGNINLSWNDNSDNENNFTIYKSIDGINFTIVSSVDAEITNYVVSNIIAEQEYWFRVTAYNTAGESDYVEIGPIAFGLSIFNFGYWPKSYWTGYWYRKYWQVWGILGTKFIPRMRRISHHRKNL